MATSPGIGQEERVSIITGGVREKAGETVLYNRGEDWSFETVAITTGERTGERVAR